MRAPPGLISFSCLPSVTGHSLSIASHLIPPGLLRICVFFFFFFGQQFPVPEVLTPRRKLGEQHRGGTSCRQPPGPGTRLFSPLWLLVLLSGVASPAARPPSFPPRIFFSSFSLSSPHFLVSKDCMSHFTLSCQMSDAVGLRVEANFFPLLKESSGLMKAPNSVIPDFSGGRGWLPSASAPSPQCLPTHPPLPAGEGHSSSYWHRAGGPAAAPGHAGGALS